MFFINTSISEYLDTITSNKMLKLTLMGQFGDLSVNPKTIPLLFALLTFKYYWKGGYFPRGGPKVIVSKLTNKI